MPAEGIALAASLLDLRVTDETGMTNTGLVAQAVIQATDQRTEVMDISLGFKSCTGHWRKNRTKTRRESGYAITTPSLASKFAPFTIAKRGFFTIEFWGTPVGS